MTPQSTLPRSIDEQARRRFEAAWRAGRPEPIEPLLPQPDDPRYLATLEELVCIELEFAWKSWRRPDASGTLPATPPLLETYLARFPRLREQPVLGRLLSQEYRVRREYGDRPPDAEYRARFPDATFIALESGTLPPGRTPEPAALPDAPGYEMLGVLGRGGMGVVYKARQLSLNRFVALKMILSGAGAAEEDLTRFRREAEVVALLQHPNVVQVYEVGDVRGRPYIALEFVGGGGLDAKLAATPQPAREAARLAETLARAVHAAHRRGIVHRDLKPANVLLTEDGTPKIADFGLAKKLDDAAGQTQSGAVVGTPSYMAPEQASGKSKEVGPASDVYALGAILYQCLTGRPPFKAATSAETLLQVLQDEPLPPRLLQPRTPRDLETICLRCLRKDPGKRYATAEALADDLGRFLRGEPIRARPVGRAERTVKWVRRRPAAAALLATLLLATCGAVAGLFVWQQQEQSRQKEDARRGERLDAIRDTVKDDEAAALAQLLAGRYEEADRTLKGADLRLRVETGLEDLGKDVQKRWDQAHRLAEFYRLTDKAERLAFMGSDAEAVAACEVGLRRLRGADELDGWDAHLPTNDLSESQVEQLQIDVNRTLVLLAGLWAKRAYLKMKANDRRGKEEDCAKVEEVLRLVQSSRPWHTRRLLDWWRRFMLANTQEELDALETLERPPLKEAPDYYFVGITQYWIGAGNGLGFEFFKVPTVLQKSGLNFLAPLATAEQDLRKAAELDPKHYWTHLWLGWTLLKERKYLAASMAFEVCIELRREHGLGHALRGNARVLLSRQTEESDLKRDLEERGLEDCRRALSWRRDDPDLYEFNYRSLMELGRRSEALESFARAVELEPPLIAWDGRPIDRNHRLAEDARQEWGGWPKQHPDEAAVSGLLALAEFALGNDDGALAHAAAVPDDSAWHPRALAVRGAVTLKTDPDKALADFEAALEKSPENYLAASGRARAREVLKQYAEALRAYDFLLREPDLADWQQLEAHLGRARTLSSLGRPREEIRQALDAAGEIDPRAADGLATQLLP